MKDHVEVEVLDVVGAGRPSRARADRSQLQAIYTCGSDLPVYKTTLHPPLFDC